MAKQPYQYNLIIKCGFIELLLFCCLYSFSQINPNTDSAKLKAISKTPLNDSVHTYGSGKVVLSGLYKSVPMPAWQDADHDGVPDQLDLEPNTPQGVEVDIYGRAIDTDGDGVPDCKDKEKLTQQSCFPVDSYGIGKCPEPACCKMVIMPAKKVVDSMICSMPVLPFITFSPKNALLNTKAKMSLDTVARLMVEYSKCRLKVVGFAEWSYFGQQLVWDRINSIVKYLSKSKGIDRERFLYSYNNRYRKNDRETDLNVIQFLPTLYYNPYVPIPPAPKYSTLKK